MYTIREITLKNNDKEESRLIIQFHDSEMEIIGEFLMTEAPVLQGEMLTLLERVLRGEEERLEMSGNRLHVHITPKETTLTDLFAEMDGVETYQRCTIETEKLSLWTKDWLERLQRHKEK